MDPIILEILERISVINEEMGGVEVAQQQIAIDVAILKIQMSNILFWGKVFGVAFAGFFATQVWQVVVLKKNGKK